MLNDENQEDNFESSLQEELSQIKFSDVIKEELTLDNSNLEKYKNLKIKNLYKKFRFKP